MTQKEKIEALEKKITELEAKVDKLINDNFLGSGEPKGIEGVIRYGN